MSFYTTASWIFFGAIFATALAVLPFRALALRIGMVDHPDNVRKLHKKPIPVGGGAVLFAVLSAVICLLIAFRDQLTFSLGVSPKLLLPLLIVSPFIVIVGLIDDKLGMSGKKKLLCQILAASIIIGFAKYYSTITFFGVELNLHHLFYPIAVFWIIGMINAINLLDGADGVAVSVSFYMALATAVMAFTNNQQGIALICLGLAGSLLGFFLHNRPSANIYLGDTGSMFIGMTLGTLILRASVEADRVISVCGPLAIVLIPMADSFFAVIRRVNSKRTIFSPDRGHIHHILSTKVKSPYSVLLMLSLLVIPGCVAAVVGTIFRNDLIPVLTALGVLSISVVTNTFGRRELRILFGRVKGLFRKSFHHEKYLKKNGEIYHIQGHGPWRETWNKLIPILSNYPCLRLQLDINIPNKNEDFFGEWENVSRRGENKSPVYCSIVLGINKRPVGTLRLCFDQQDCNLDDLFRVISTVAGICELSIRQYLDSGELDPVVSTLSFTTAQKEALERDPLKPKELQETKKPENKQRVA